MRLYKGRFHVIKTREGMRRTICAGYIWNFERTVCGTENTMESRSAISNTFHNNVEERNPSNTRRRRPLPTPASLLYPP